MFQKELVLMAKNFLFLSSEALFKADKLIFEASCSATEAIIIYLLSL